MKQWSKKEKKDATLFGGRRTPRSGGLWFAKGDVKSDVFLIENKTTKHKSFSITDKIWEKIEKEALLNKRIPMLSIEFGDAVKELIVLDKNDFITIIWKEKHNT
jgi:hypothetical protein